MDRQNSEESECSDKAQQGLEILFMLKFKQFSLNFFFIVRGNVTCFKTNENTEIH